MAYMVQAGNDTTFYALLHQFRRRALVILSEQSALFVELEGAYNS
jgi:hypothetical protein